MQIISYSFVILKADSDQITILEDIDAEGPIVIFFLTIGGLNHYIE